MVKNTKKDWNALKLKYLQSNVASAEKFYRAQMGYEKGHVLSGFEKRKLTGWSAEKQEVKTEAYENAKQKLIKKFSYDNEQLLDLKQKAFDLIKDKLEKGEVDTVTYEAKEVDPDDDGKIKVKKLKRIDYRPLKTRELLDIIETLKIELGEPTTISTGEIGGPNGGPIKVDFSDVPYGDLEKMKQKLIEEING